MVRVGNTDIGRCIGGDIGDDVVVNGAVVRIGTDIHMNVGVEGLKVLNGLFIDLDLGLVGIVLGPEGNVVISGGVEFFRQLKGYTFGGSVAACQQSAADKDQHQHKRQKSSSGLFHPLIPPLETPAMIFLRKIRKRTISGTEMATTAAIMAGTFSRPKPF